MIHHVTVIIDNARSERPGVRFYFLFAKRRGGANGNIPLVYTRNDTAVVIDGNARSDGVPRLFARYLRKRTFVHVPVQIIVVLYANSDKVDRVGRNRTFHRARRNIPVVFIADPDERSVRPRRARKD